MAKLDECFITLSKYYKVPGNVYLPGTAGCITTSACGPDSLQRCWHGREILRDPAGAHKDSLLMDAR